MKKNLFVLFLALMSLALSGSFSYTYSAAPMEGYCQTPPIVSQAVQPNVMLALDSSGSMSWCAYYTGSDSSHCDPNCVSGPGGTGCGTGYNKNTTYEGYFNPGKYYNQDANSIWQEYTPTGKSCSVQCIAATCKSKSNQCTLAGQYGSGSATSAAACSLIGGGCSKGKYCCCTATATTGDCDTYSGNFLNYIYMQRIDLLRWAMTGGMPSTCTGSHIFNPPYCDPEVWSTLGNGSGMVSTVCGNNNLVNGDGVTQSGCILQTANIKNVPAGIKVPWDRISGSCSINPLTNTDPSTCASAGGDWTPSGGLVFTFETLPVQPRLGEMAFSNSSVNDYIYVGDFTQSGSTQANFPYMNLITHVNSIVANGSTPTGPAMWDILNYYAQNSSQYGGPVPETGGNHWKNPMYICPQGSGSQCYLIPCAGNYVILMSDGQWNTNGSGNTACSIGSSPSCSAYSSDPVVPAYCMHKGFTNAASGNPLVSTKVNAVYTIALFPGQCSITHTVCTSNSDCQGGTGDTCTNGTGALSLENVAMYGSFNNLSKTWPDSLTSFPAGTCSSMTDCTVSPYKGSACTALPSSSPDWDSNVDGSPDTYFSASEAIGIKTSILNAILDILRRATSGTAVSILASGEGSGANLLQAFFYPEKDFSGTDVTWIGEMQNLWYYLDPKLQVSTIREDTDADKQLELKDDYVVHFRFDSTQNKTVADLYKDTTGSGTSLVFQNTVDLAQTKYLWEAGSLLWSTPASSRTLYTTTNGASLINFSTGNAGTLQNYLQAASSVEATNLVKYTSGIDVSSYCLTSGNTCTSDTDCTGGADTCTSYRSRTVTLPPGTTANVWKLGDIISSTPRMESWINLNTYSSDPPTGYGDGTYSKYTGSNNYQNRGMVYTGANDGMLHAFKLGAPKILNSVSDPLLIAELDNNDLSTSLGQEMWSFIPKNALPYLRYLADPNYCHLYYVDAPPYLFDSSINVPTDCTTGDYSTCLKKTTYVTGTKNLDLTKTSWRTIVIGSMGQGGACRQTTAACNLSVCSQHPATTCTSNINCPNHGSGETCLPACVKTPVDISNASQGYSSYFALDVTDPLNPALLWEFSDPGLGFSMSGPSVLRVNGNTPMGTRYENGKWYVVIASGPTGPIDTSSNQFLASSDQHLKLYVLDLKSGALLRTIDTGLANAFGGSIMNAPIDTDRWNPSSTENYEDNVLYIGYTQLSGGNWVGGVLRLTTGNTHSGEDSNVNNWNLSTLISGIGPVTSGISHLQDRTNHLLWLYFGTGRYFYKVGTTIDDANSQQKIYGVKEPCYQSNDTLDMTCSTSVSTSSLDDATTNPPTNPAHGWFINLDPSGSSYMAERVITNPLAAFTSAVYFTTFAPSTDVCGFSGNTYLWAVNYNTGGSAIPSALKGTALIQLASGQIAEVSLQSAFTDKVPTGSTQGRRANVGPAPPPKGQGLSVVINPRPMKRILHMQER